MSEEILDSLETDSKNEQPIDEFFKVYTIFFSITLLLSFLLSLFNAPENALIKLFFNASTFAVIAFSILYVILLIVRKKGMGRIIMNLINTMGLTVVAIGLVFFFARWPYRLEMLTTGLLTVSFLVGVQLIYELAVREEKTKFLSIISSLGIAVFAVGLLFFLQKWPSGTEMLVGGGLITVVMTVVHLGFVLKKEARYDIHIRYLAQCVYAIVSALMLMIVA